VVLLSFEGSVYEGTQNKTNGSKQTILVGVIYVSVLFQVFDFDLEGQRISWSSFLLS
jgi:hypothetical protein